MILQRPAGSLYYEIQGQGEEVVVYLNGFASGISNWYPVIKGLKRRYRNVLYDYIGTGESRSDSSYRFNFDNYCADLDALIHQIGVDGVHLVGYSMGGWIAQEFSLRHPQRVKSLALINSSSRIFGRQHWIIAHFIEVLKCTEISVFSKLMFLSYYSPEYFERHLDHLERIKNLANVQFEKHARQNWDALLRSCLTFNAEDRLETLRLPVLVLSGEHDILCPRMTAQRLVDLIPNAQWTELSVVGHAIPMEKHRSLATILEAFLLERPLETSGCIHAR